VALAAVTRPAETLRVLEGVSTRRNTWMESGRHGGGVNGGFLDGHVRWLPPGEIERRDTNGQGRYWLHYGTIDH
jgi:prepilin-type processing-associated H-X9-DG protein